jgi:hypothetical protein
MDYSYHKTPFLQLMKENKGAAVCLDVSTVTQVIA